MQWLSLADDPFWMCLDISLFILLPSLSLSYSAYIRVKVCVYISSIPTLAFAQALIKVSAALM